MSLLMLLVTTAAIAADAALQLPPHAIVGRFAMLLLMLIGAAIAADAAARSTDGKPQHETQSALRAARISGPSLPSA